MPATALHQRVGYRYTLSCIKQWGPDLELQHPHPHMDAVPFYGIIHRPRRSSDFCSHFLRILKLKMAASAETGVRVGARVVDKDSFRGIVRYIGPVASSKNAEAVYAGEGYTLGKRN